jgi:hypothetical protein
MLVAAGLIALFSYHSRMAKNCSILVLQEREKWKLMETIVTALLAIVAVTLIFGSQARAGVTKSEDVPIAVSIVAEEASGDFENWQTQMGPIRLSPRWVSERDAYYKPFLVTVAQAEYWCQWTLHDLELAHNQGKVELNSITSVFTVRADRSDTRTAAYEACAELELLMATIQ